jgi:hypothetical protein
MVHRPDGNRRWDGIPGGDTTFSFGAATDKPVVGDWNGDGKSDAGVFRNGTYMIDANGNRKWDMKTGGDDSFTFGIAGDIPLSGVWSFSASGGQAATTQVLGSAEVSRRSVDQVFTAENLGSLLSPALTRKKQFFVL